RILPKTNVAASVSAQIFDGERMLAHALLPRTGRMHECAP
ncbi:MAG: hypothetical protein ACI91J_004023, partial [Yoonia sp.]